MYAVLLRFLTAPQMAPRMHMEPFESRLSLKQRRGIGLVFASPTGKTFEYSKRFNRALKAAAVENFKFHDCRHSAASYMAQNGMTLLEIAHVLGHKSVIMTQRYAHLCTETVTRAGDLLNKKLFEL